METKIVNVHESAPSLADLLAMVATADEIILADGDKPVARLLHIEPVTPARTAGLHPQAMQISDDFDAPLPDDFWVSKA